MRNLSRVHVMVVMFVLTLLNASCGSSFVDKKDAAFTSFLVHPEVKDLNKSIELRVNPYDENTFRIGDSVILEVVNMSSKIIYFPADENIQIFRYDDTIR